MTTPIYSSELTRILEIEDRRQAFIHVTHLFLKTDDAERSLIRSNWDFGRSWIPTGIEYTDEDHALFRPISGTDDFGTTPEEAIQAILVSRAIVRDEAFDVRDDISNLCLLHHAALEANLNPEELFERAASVAMERFSKLLLSFQRRTPIDKSLWAMGYRKRVDGNAIEFEWFGNDSDYDQRRPAKLDRWGREID